MRAVRTARYIVFIPAAVVASLLAGTVGHWFGSFGYWIYDGSEVMAWLMSGLGSGFAFVFVGLRVAPEPTERIKKVLLILLGCLGAISAFGSVLIGTNLLSGIAGSAMLMIAIALFRVPASELEQ